MEKSEREPFSAEEAAEKIRIIMDEVARAFIGQRNLLENLMITLIAGGHILVEGVPGLGKTLMVRALAQVMGGEWKRVQFTPDLMPSDITGHVMLDAPTGRFITRKGPVFTHLLIADEINRAPAKTQAALFEAMQEYQVSFDGETHPLPRPFLTLATQNPLEHEGTYPLPDAQKDRFLMKTLIDYPQGAEEKEMVRLVTDNRTGEDFNLAHLESRCSLEEMARLQMSAAAIAVSDEVLDYALRLVQASRNRPGIAVGAGPRATLALIRTAKARALLKGRSFVLPDDVKKLALPVLRHRINPSAESEIEGATTEILVQAIIDQTEAPRQ